MGEIEEKKPIVFGQGYIASSKLGIAAAKEAVAAAVAAAQRMAWPSDGTVYQSCACADAVQ
jgi:hypothetical protein